MYDKELAARVFKIMKKKAMNISKSNDALESAFMGTELVSMLELFSEIIKLEDTRTINIIKITKEG